MVKKKKITKWYCKHCGKKEQPYETGKFSIVDGSPEIATQCMNTKCKVGCYNNGGHVYLIKTNFKIFKSKGMNCERCGYYDSWRSFDGIL